MPQTVLGLDISAHTIKAVLFAPRGLTGGRVLDAWMLDINACGGIEGALKKLAENKSFANNPCYVCLPPADIIFRHVTLPFRDDNKIRKTLAFELEPLIPLSIDEVVADYLTIPGDGLLVAALAKNIVGEWIEKVEGNLGKLSIIDIAPTALAAQVIAEKTSAACGIILDIGASSTAAVFYENHAMVQIRSLAFGGSHITAALAADLSVEQNEAEQMKINANYPTECVKTEEACRHFCLELKNTLEYMKLNGLLQNDPAQITVTGGGSLFIPLQKELENSFSLPLNVLDLVRLKQMEIGENIHRRHLPQIMNTAIAAAMRSSSGRKSLNFRQGEFAATNIRLNFKGQLKWTAVVAGIIFLLAIINQALDYGQKTQQLNNIKKQISLTFRKNFPESQAMVDPPQQLKTKLEENKKAFGFYKGNSETTVLNIIKEISNLVSRPLDIIITNFNYENSIVSIKGEAKNMDDVSAVRNELLKSKYFKDVAMGSTSLVKDSGKVNFDLRIELK